MKDGTALDRIVKTLCFSDSCYKRVCDKKECSEDCPFSSLSLDTDGNYSVNCDFAIGGDYQIKRDIIEAVLNDSDFDNTIADYHDLQREVDEWSKKYKNKPITFDGIVNQKNLNYYIGKVFEDLFEYVEEKDSFKKGILLERIKMNIEKENKRNQNHGS